MSDPLHILFVSERYPTEESYNAISVHHRARALQALGQRVTVITGHAGNDLEETWDGVPLFRIGLKGHRWDQLRFPKRALAQARLLFARTPFNVVHGHWATAAGYSAVKIGQALNRPSVVTCKGFDVCFDPATGYGARASWFLRRMVNKTLRGADQLIAISPFMQDLMTAWGTARPIEVIYPACPDPFITPPASGARPYTDRLRLIMVGSLIPRKHVDHIMEAMGQASFSEDMELCVVGKGPEKERLEQLARRLGLEKQVHFAGSKNHQELIELYDQANLFVCPSVQEGFGVVYLEAMARGLPVLLTSDCGAAGLVEKYKCGFVIAPSQIGQLAEILDNLIKNQGTTKTMGNRGSAAVQQNHTYRHLAENLIRIYTDLC